MHSLQLVLVEANSNQDAIEVAEFEINNGKADGAIAWSDWWQIAYDAAPRTLNQTEPVIHYVTDPLKFEESLSTWVNFRLEHIDLHYSRVQQELDLDNAVKQYSTFSRPTYNGTMGLFSLNALSEILLDHWTPDTAVYDLVEYTANLSFFRERLSENPSEQYAVLVDFHQ